MKNNLTWYLSAGVIILYTMLPAFWMYLMVGYELPATVVNMSAVWLTAFGCAILTCMGYALGRSYPEDILSLDEWYENRQAAKGKNKE